MSWRKTYSARITTAAAAVKTICSGQRWFLSGNTSMPQTLVQALVQRVWHRAGTLGADIFAHCTALSVLWPAPGKGLRWCGGDCELLCGSHPGLDPPGGEEHAMTLHAQ
jgi:hypothetical protein